MLKKTALTAGFVAVAGCLILGSAAFGDSLRVTSAAGMGGVAANTCTGDGLPGPCGLQVDHTSGTPIAYVQDNTPTSETVYRAEFLFSENDVSLPGGPGAAFRQVIFTAIGPNPRPGVGVCPSTLAFIEAIRCFHIAIDFGAGPNSHYQCHSRGDFCGERSTNGVFFHTDADIDGDDNVKFCIEWEHGVGTDAGKIRLAVIDDGDSCSGATYQVGDVTNNDVRVDFIRLGTPQANFFGAGETVEYHFDEFASFRTLAP